MTFIKGDKRINRNGRPKGSGLNLTSLLKEELEKIPKNGTKTYKKMFIQKLLHKALVEGDTQSLKLIINYTDGLPEAKLGEQDHPLKIKVEMVDAEPSE